MDDRETLALVSALETTTDQTSTNTGSEALATHSIDAAIDLTAELPEENPLGERLAQYYSILTSPRASPVWRVSPRLVARLSAEQHANAQRYAYDFWEEAGRPEGRDLEFWYRGVDRVWDEMSRGRNFSPIDAGYFYAPYIPITRTPVFFGNNAVYENWGKVKLDPHDDDPSFFRHGL